MKPAALGFAVAAVSAVALQGQSGPPSTAFEMAEIHTSAPGSTQAMRGGVPRDGIYRLRKATMLDLVRVAYGVDADKVTGGPSWLELDRFDITAKVPPGTNRETVKPMLQALLADRFKLVVRAEPKPFPVQTLVTAGMPKLKESSGSTAGTCVQTIDPPAAGRTTLTLVTSCKGTSMATFAERLGGLAGQGVQVVDATGLAGLWDFDFRFSPAIGSSSVTLTPAALSDALEKSLGLKLDARSVSLPTVGVVSVERTPTPNSPAAAAAFPAGPDPEFEVAEVKASTSDRQTRQILPTGQFTATGVSMRTLLGMAFPGADPALIVGPKSLDTAKFDVIAKFSTRPVDPSEIDQDEIGVMLQKLLADRVRLKTHREDRVMEAPTLVAAGPHKLVKADPNGRTKCTQGVSAQRSQNSPVPIIQLKCQNVTLTEFAERAQRLDPGNTKGPMAEETRIDGRWDITVDFTPTFMLNAVQQGMAAGRAAAQAAGATPAADLATDPMGALPLSQAIEKQLGLKIEMRRRPVSVLVVDSFDEKPSGD